MGSDPEMLSALAEKIVNKEDIGRTVDIGKATIFLLTERVVVCLPCEFKM